MSQILYHSTRDSQKTESLSSAAAIKQGLASDGGLFVPESLPTVSEESVKALIPLSYPERAAKILSMFPDLKSLVSTRDTLKLLLTAKALE